MISKSQQLLLVIGLCLSVASSADVDCTERPKFVNPTKCCPIHEFISVEVKEKCQQYNVTPSEQPPMSDEQSGEGRHRHHHHHHHHPRIFQQQCLVSCIFNETGFYEDNKLDETKLDDYLKLTIPDDVQLQTVTKEAFISCAAKAKEFKDKFGNRPRPSPPPSQSMCPRKPAFLTGCVYFNLLQNCPPTIWNNSAECSENREFFKNCKSPRRRPSSEDKSAA
ncbi:uncharacterized protein LOC6560083 [Drosophila grimshawi]|uniref:GH19957 n=1 Tax=Drosophila grimshawi TaxID=7222 RepID=B4J8G0_DROGR|nr:uncharacterized protein LOC6560083 [Drosophila grimshawi]EDW02319.1 GH19957 [Drosophila grimshawi]